MDRPDRMEDVPPELLRECADDFAELVAEQLPMAFESEVTWKLIAAGFLARISAIFESMTTLVERAQDADAMALLRVLYDHAATFCWLGIDPDNHVAEWRRWEDYRRLAVHNDAATFGVEVLDEDELREIGKPSRPRGLAELADAIDRHWPDHIAAFRAHPGSGAKEIRSFRGLYAAIFRKASGLVHATEAGLHRHTRVRPTQVVVTVEERQPEPGDVPGFAVPMTAFVLLVYRHHFGWPEDARARQITELLVSADER